MNIKVLTRISTLRSQIKSENFQDDVLVAEEWSGADVMIRSRLDEETNEWLWDQPNVVSRQENEPCRIAVVTIFSKELSWLFIQLKEAFAESIDYVSKYDFYGALARAANDYLSDTYTPERQPLLLTVLNTAETFHWDNKNKEN
ncbi:hypothetical protein N9B10_06990 [Pirellulales bacterium]|nr:hypothetical protein [Pirellulales bacterium]